MKPEPLGTAILVLDSSKEKILLGKRKNAYRAGMLGLPGGRLHLTEKLVGCVGRELVEETGLQVTTSRYLGVVREQQDGYTFVHFVFFCEEYTGSPEVKEPEKCEGWEWYPLTNLPEGILSGHAAAIDLWINRSLPGLRDMVSKDTI